MADITLYLYQPSHVLPIVFATLVGTSLLLHIYQNFRYRFWGVTFWLFWGGTVFMTGWVLRAIASYSTTNANLYIAQKVFILAGPPIYSAAAYNILGRLMHYLPMHATLHPARTVYFFVYIGILVESLTAAGASMQATASTVEGIPEKYITGGTLISISLVLQGVVECLFIAMVAQIHARCARSQVVPRNIKYLCIMLYGTSTIVLFRCIARAIESFATETVTSCEGICRVVLFHEWYLYAFEAAPMVLYTYWMNILHPGTLLPREKTRYYDSISDRNTERMGPGWIDKRSQWETFVDPIDLSGTLKGQPSHEKFWLKPSDWPIAEGGSFADGSATNVKNGRRKTAKRESESEHHMA